MDDVIEHLSDGEPVALPYAHAGHHPVDSRQRLRSSPWCMRPTLQYYRLPLLLLAETEDGGIAAVAATGWRT